MFHIFIIFMKWDFYFVKRKVLLYSLNKFKIKKLSFYLENNIFKNQQKHIQPNHLTTLNTDNRTVIWVNNCEVDCFDFFRLQLNYSYEYSKNVSSATIWYPSQARMSSLKECRFCLSNDNENLNIFSDFGIETKMTDIVNEHFKCEVRTSNYFFTYRIWSND